MTWPMTAEEFVRIYGLAMELGLVRRATQHASGEAESDTTHTVGLAYVAMICAQRMMLDVARVLTMALVHDLVEAYAGDVCTAVELSPAARAEKNAREAEALKRILGEVPELGRWIKAYEAQACAESQLVNYLDKMCPTAAHVLSGGSVVIEALGLTLEQVKDVHSAQAAKLRERHPTVRVHDLFRELCAASERSIEAWQGDRLANAMSDPRRDRVHELVAKADCLTSSRRATVADHEEARTLLVEAAVIEEAVAFGVPASKPRTRTALAVSAVTLWSRAWADREGVWAAKRFLATPGITAEGAVELRALQETMERAIREDLSHRDRFIIQAVCGVGLSFAEAGVLTGLTRARAQQIVRRHRPGRMRYVPDEGAP